MQVVINWMGCYIYLIVFKLPSIFRANMDQRWYQRPRLRTKSGRSGHLGLGEPAASLSKRMKCRRPKWSLGGVNLFQVSYFNLFRIYTTKALRGMVIWKKEIVKHHISTSSGVLDKNQYGSTPFSLVHAFFELYGGAHSGKLQSAFSKIFTNFLHTEGFTLGVRDILVKEEANIDRKIIMDEARRLGTSFPDNTNHNNHRHGDQIWR